MTSNIKVTNTWHEWTEKHTVPEILWGIFPTDRGCRAYTQNKPKFPIKPLYFAYL